MRLWLVVASLWLLVTLSVPDAQAKNRPRNQDGNRRGKRRKDGYGNTLCFFLLATVQIFEKIFFQFYISVQYRGRMCLAKLH